MVKPKSRGGRVAAPALVERLVPAQAGQEGNLSVETIRINFKAGDMAVHPAHGVQGEPRPGPQARRLVLRDGEDDELSGRHVDSHDAGARAEEQTPDGR